LEGAADLIERLGDLDLVSADLDREIVAREGLRGFVEVAWGRIDPAPFVHARVIDEICDHLEAVQRGDIRNLLICVPPGMSKSSIVMVLFQAYVWIKDPAQKFICAANDPSLALRDARRVRDYLIQTPWWAARWPHVKIANNAGSNAVGEYETTAMGFRVSLGIGERVVGRHANYKMFDDPNKPLDTEGTNDVSRAGLLKVIEAWDGTFSSRNTDVKTTRTVGVMQRLHDLDLAGHLIERSRTGGDKFEILRLPMEFETSAKCVTSVGGDWRTTEGELLCPERFDAESVALLKGKLGNPRRVSAQLQQRPVPKGGNIIKAEWIRHWGPCSEACRERNCPGPVRAGPRRVEEFTSMESSWDLTFKGGSKNDFVVGQVWGYSPNEAELVDQVRKQMTFLESVREFKAMTAKHPKAYIKRIEDKANAPALVNVLQAEIMGMKLTNPEGSKQDRLDACEGLFEAGVVIYPSPLLHPWVDDINLHEILNFPAAAHDDTVDATTQALKKLTTGDRAQRMAAFNRAAVGK
jgi:predicted phage terminase large subunit-like protein